MEERRLRTEDNPQSLVYEALARRAFQAHPYRRPIIGWMDDLEHMTLEGCAGLVPHLVYADQRLRGRRRRRRPQGRVRSRREDLRQDQAARALPDASRRTSRAQAGIKRVIVKAPAKLPYLSMAWKVPKLRDVDKDREPYALEVLATVLDGHDAARFSKNLVRGTKMAPVGRRRLRRHGARRGAVHASMASPPRAGRWLTWKRRCAPRSRACRTRASRAEELARVKTQTIAGQVYKRDS